MSDEQVTRMLTDHEARIKVLEKIHEKLDRILTSVTRLETRAENQHTPDTCELRRQVTDHEKRLRALEGQEGKTQGGLAVAGKILPYALALLAFLAGLLLKHLIGF